MAEGKSQNNWQHTSSIMALIANVNRDPKQRARPFKPSDFDPYRQPAETTQPVVISKESLQEMKETFKAFAKARK